jgi:hypothetical protein
MYQITKRSLIRLVAFPVAVIMFLIIALCVKSAETIEIKRALENNNKRAVFEFSRSVENIKTALNKGLYSNSPQMLNSLSEELARSACSAKSNLSQFIPTQEIDLEATYKFLSQVRDYSKTLSRRAVRGDETSAEDAEKHMKLLNYVSALSENLRGGELSLPEHVFPSFREAQGEPYALIGLEQISEDDALEAALYASGAANLTLSAEEYALPSYIFTNNSTTVAITKAGGRLSYMLGYREVEAERITAGQASSSARKFLEKLGITEITDVKSEIRSGVLLVDFAGVQNDVTLYPDLIKVSVAMDTGEVISLDAREWLKNHRARNIGQPTLDVNNAAARLSPLLTVESAKLCIIAPDDSADERLCYEFFCVTESGQRFLVYINAETGDEERILQVF